MLKVGTETFLAQLINTKLRWNLKTRKNRKNEIRITPEFRASDKLVALKNLCVRACLLSKFNVIPPKAIIILYFALALFSILKRISCFSLTFIFSQLFPLISYLYLFNTVLYYSSPISSFCLDFILFIFYFFNNFFKSSACVLRSTFIDAFLGYVALKAIETFHGDSKSASRCEARVQSFSWKLLYIDIYIIYEYNCFSFPQYFRLSFSSKKTSTALGQVAGGITEIYL